MNNIQLPVQITSQKLIKPNLEVIYPQIRGLGKEKINRTILNLVYKLINEQGYYQSPGMKVNGSYEIKTNERGVLSLSLINYAYPPHAAHGMTIIKSITADLQTGKIYTLSELFNPSIYYLGIISDLIKEQIETRNIPLLKPFDVIKTDQDYYIADKILVIYFQLYELTPYAFGFPEFPISVYQIESIIKPGTPLFKMLGAY
jgi:hypothetical protein